MKATLDQTMNALRLVSPARPILLVGGAGVGKSEIVATIAEARGEQLVVEHPAMAEAVDYRGLPSIVDGRAQWLPIGALRDLCSPDCPPTILLLDDLGQAIGSVQAACMQLVLSRHIGDHRLADTVSIVAATNRSDDRAGVRQILAPLRNRLLIVEIEASAAEWASWAIARDDIPALYPAYARFRGDIFTTPAPDGIQAWTTPRSLALAARLEHEHGSSALPWLAGYLGPAVAADLAVYRGARGALPTLDEMLAPRWTPSASLARDPGLMHALCALVARAQPLQALAVAAKLADEWSLCLMSDAVARHGDALKQTPQFQGWAVAHKHFL
jgi:hypothetical protein